MLEGTNPETVFDRIYEENYWGSAESGSGPGSTVERTREYVLALTTLIRDRGFKSMFDAPCGDLNWMPLVLSATGISYLGGDISQHALRLARRKSPHADLRQFNICEDDFPDAELWHCRDCLFHLSFEDGLKALRNVSKSKIEFALITTNSSLWSRNIDIVTGGSRETDLQRSPYNLPRPILKLRDYPRRGKEPRRYVGLWSINSIAKSVLG